MRNFPEEEFKKTVLLSLREQFIIEEQVLGTHFSGKQLKIDAIIRPINTTDWKNPNVAFGIEFKAPSKLSSTHDVTHWISQVIDYANTNWEGYGYLYILSCPGFFEHWTLSMKPVMQVLQRIFSDLGVGELNLHHNYGWCIYLQERHLIWSEKRGVVSGKHWNLERKFGHK